MKQRKMRWIYSIKNDRQWMFQSRSFSFKKEVQNRTSVPFLVPFFCNSLIISTGCGVGGSNKQFAPHFHALSYTCKSAFCVSLLSHTFAYNRTNSRQPVPFLVPRLFRGQTQSSHQVRTSLCRVCL